MEKKLETLTGKIVKVFSDKGNWASVVVKLYPGCQIRAAGNIIGAADGLQIEMVGSFYEDPRFGEQFKVERSKIVRVNETDIVDYLGSAFVKGIGPITAQKIYDMFGVRSIDIVENHPEELVKVKGISMAKALMAQKSLQENRSFLNVYEFLGGHATSNQVKTIVEKYGRRAIEVLKENPYIVIYDLDGFGFKRADALASAAGILPNDPRRICAAITYTLKTLQADGHCFCFVDSLEENLKLLVEDVNAEKLGEYIVKEINSGHLVLDGEKLYTADMYQAEVTCANILVELAKTDPVVPISMKTIEAAIYSMECESGFELEKKQRDAIMIACKRRVSVITGGPGTGKTTIVKAVVRAAERAGRVLLAAPTGKASRRMSELTDGREATTIHRMLMMANIHDSKKGTIEDNPFLIIDEASMLDISLASKVLEFVKRREGRVVFIGDVDQLPPIGPGSFLRDLVESPVIPTVKLELCHRQHGKIAINAARINSGKGTHTFSYDNTFQVISASGQAAQDLMIEQYLEATEHYSIRDICCLTPMRKKGRSLTSADTLNEIIRDKINPLVHGTPVLRDFRLGDRVMETQNDNAREVYNGDCGIISDVDTRGHCIWVDMDDGRRIQYMEHELDTLILAYAMTVHKSQGSEFKVAIIANCKEHFIMLQRNLLYTAVTRARDKVIIIGTPQAIDIAVKTVKALQRNTMLKHRIMEKALS